MLQPFPLLSLTDLVENSEESGEGDSDRESEGGDDDWKDDKEWSKIQKSIREERKKKEAGMKRESYPVHSPFFPAVRLKYSSAVKSRDDLTPFIAHQEKHEMWWVYLADRKKNTMVLPPEKVLGLVDTKEVRPSLHD